MEARKKFEALPEIAKILKYKEQSYFDKNTGEYVSLYSYKTGFLNGAWFAFQEQENKIKALEKELEMRKQGASVMSWHRDQIIEIVNSYHSGSDTDDMRDEILEILK